MKFVFGYHIQYSTQHVEFSEEVSVTASYWFAWVVFHPATALYPEQAAQQDEVGSHPTSCRDRNLQVLRHL
jgi:hypothetical protein